MAVSDLAAAPSPPPARFTRAPGWLMQAAMLVTAIGLLDAASAPGCFIFEFLGFALLGIVLAGVWLVRLLLALRRNQRTRWWRRTWWRWAAGPAILVAVLVLLETQIPVRIRFELSRNQLNGVAQAALASKPAQPIVWWSTPIQHAGAFNVALFDVTPDGAVFYRVPGTEFMRSCSGFIYSPHAAPWDPQGSVESLGGPWYIWHTSW